MVITVIARVLSVAVVSITRGLWICRVGWILSTVATTTRVSSYIRPSARTSTLGWGERDWVINMVWECSLIFNPVHVVLVKWKCRQVPCEWVTVLSNYWLSGAISNLYPTWGWKYIALAIHHNAINAEWARDIGWWVLNSVSKVDIVKCSTSVIETYLPKDGIVVGLNSPFSDVLVSKLTIGERTDMEVAREVSVNINDAECLVALWCTSLHVCSKPKCAANIWLVLYPVIEGNANTTWVSRCDVCSSHPSTIWCINWEWSSFCWREF